MQYPICIFNYVYILICQYIGQIIVSCEIILAMIKYFIST